MRRDAALAMAQRHRDWLEREELIGHGTIVFCGLNPSTATDEVDDPTIRRERGFAKRLGFKRYIKLNLFTARATDPANLSRMDDPVGPGAETALEEALGILQQDEQKGVESRFVCAWGASPQGSRKIRALHRERVLITYSVAQKYRIALWALGFTKHGEPRHPLYLRGDAEMVPFDPVGVA